MSRPLRQEISKREGELVQMGTKAGRTQGKLFITLAICFSLNKLIVVSTMHGMGAGLGTWIEQVPALSRPRNELAGE